MRIAAVGRALPPHRYDQDTVARYLDRLWEDSPDVARRAATLHRNTRVAQRHFAQPAEDYLGKNTFGQANDTWIRVAVDLGEHAMRQALDRAGLAPADVDQLMAVSVTGIASPSLDARLVNRLRLRPDVKRVPVFGLGCVAGAAGIARAADYVRGHPRQVAVLLSVELCSLNFQPDDHSIANLISIGLFGDGAAAVVVTGAERAAAGPEILATRSVFYPDTEDVMGWDISERGFGIVLSPAVPEVARTRLPVDVDRFLADQDLRRADIGSWVCHPGGPKVLAAVQEGLGLSDDDVAAAWHVLETQGNLSSTSVLMVLDETMTRARPRPGTLGLVLAMGPGFCSELVLLRW